MHVLLHDQFVIDGHTCPPLGKQISGVRIVRNVVAME